MTSPAPAHPKPPRRSGWTPERRRRQAESIRRWAPWKKSTGPRTAEGKSRSRYNAWKHGMRGAQHRRFARTLRAQGAFLRYVRAWIRCQKVKNPANELLEGLRQCGAVSGSRTPSPASNFAQNLDFK